MACAHCKGTGLVWAPATDGSRGYNVECPNSACFVSRVRLDGEAIYRQESARAIDAHLAMGGSEPDE